MSSYRQTPIPAPQSHQRLLTLPLERTRRLRKNLRYPPRTAVDVFPTVWVYRDELDEPVGNAWDEGDFNVVFLVEFGGGLFKADFLAFLEEVQFRLAQAAGEYDSVIYEGVALAG